MKILLTADIHCNRFWYEWLITKAPELDLIAIAGDLVEGFAVGVLTDQRRSVEYWLGQIVASGCAVAVSSGNHEMFSKISPRVLKNLTVGRILESLMPSPSPASCHPLFLEDGRTGIIESASGTE
jgi:predicted MPP superfamily phosphohydrolase